MLLEFCYIDVFSAEKFRGNPAAVFFEADELDEKIMQKIANELNLSETVFLHKPTKSGADYKARIFTPKRELPFAGHPTIAANFAFREKHKINKPSLTQECGAGLIEVFKENSVFFVRQNDPQFAEIEISKDEISQMFSVPKKEVSDLKVFKISTGIWWAVFFLNSVDAISNAAPDHQKIIEFSQKHDLVGVQIFAKTNSTPEIHIRTFAPICGVFEDPACGSGNGCVAAFIAKNNLLKNSTYSISQGTELGRESRIYAAFNKVGDEIKNIRIGGEVVKVLEGKIEI